MEIEIFIISISIIIINRFRSGWWGLRIVSRFVWLIYKFWIATQLLELKTKRKKLNMVKNRTIFQKFSVTYLFWNKIHKYSRICDFQFYLFDMVFDWIESIRLKSAWACFQMLAPTIQTKYWINTIVLIGFKKKTWICVRRLPIWIFEWLFMIHRSISSQLMRVSI